MVKMKISILLVICLYSNLLKSQRNFEKSQHFSCATDIEIYNSQYGKYKSLELYNKAFKNDLIENKVDYNKSSMIQTIPIVVHIIHNGDPIGSRHNPSDQDVEQIIQNASDRFRHQHPNAGSYGNPYYGPDTEIELCLSNINPSGNYTAGIMRYNNPDEYISPSNSYRNSISWNPNLYCNIFVCRLSGTTCGYSNGNHTVYSTNCTFDELILMHELGHYLSLPHTFNGGCNNNDCLLDGDFVCDTPPTLSGYNGASSSNCSMSNNPCITDEDDTSTNNPYRSIALGGLGDQPEMLENYMDYTAGCWDAYTVGQKNRMQFNLLNVRSALVSNSNIACAGPNIADYDIGVLNITEDQASNCDGNVVFTFDVFNYGSKNISSFNIDYFFSNTLIKSENHSQSILPNTSITISSLSPVNLPMGNENLLSISTSQPNGFTDQENNNNADYTRITYIGGDTCNSLSYCQDFSSGTNSNPPVPTIIQYSTNFPSYPINSYFGLQLCLTVQGDINSPLFEYFEIYDEDNKFKGITSNTITDCDDVSEPICFTITEMEYINWISDSVLEITLIPWSTAIGTWCQVNEACIELNFPMGSNNCVSGYNLLNGNLLTGDVSEVTDYECYNFIESEQHILASRIIYDAGQSINLLPGFEIQQGSIFQAVIDGCNNNH